MASCKPYLQGTQSTVKQVESVEWSLT